MPLTPSPSPLYVIPPMFVQGQPATAALFNGKAQILLDSIQNVRNGRTALETQITNLENTLNTVGPNFAALVTNANNLKSQIDSAIANNEASNTELTNVQNQLITNEQNAQIQLNRIPVIAALIDSLTIGGEILGYSDLLNRIAAATVVASRILGTDASGNIIWRTVGSIGSGVTLKVAIMSRKLADNVGGGVAPSTPAWNTIALETPFFDNIGLIFNPSTREFNVPAGEYITFGFTVGAAGAKCRLRNIGAGTILAMGNPAKGTTASAIVGTQPVNFISRMMGTFFNSAQITADFQAYYEGQAPVTANTMGASSNLSGYTPQQSALVLLRIVY